MKNYVIIGNGVAAAGCIEGIRSIDRDGRITVISEENHAVYCRPLISYYLEGKTDLRHMQYRSADFYEQNACQVLYGRKAARILPETKEVELTDRSRIPYDCLTVASGSAPFVPHFEGLETVREKYSFMTLDDALKLEQSLTKDTRVLIVGAGLIGLKCAEGILRRVKSVAVCDLADRVLSSILDQECAAMMQKHLEAQGMIFYLGDSVSRFEPGTAHMQSGRNVEFDVLVLAVGVRANAALLLGCGGEVNRGIIVDDQMQTSLPGIYAAGDCAEGPDLLTGGNRVLAILPNAYMQGFTAGINMAGGNARFDRGIPMNSIGFFGLHAMTAGVYDGEVYAEKTDRSLKRLFVKDGFLRGFILIGCDERAGIYTSLIREQTPLSEVNFELLKKGATTAAFSAKTRRKKFGGMV